MKKWFALLLVTVLVCCAAVAAAQERRDPDEMYTFEVVVVEIHEYNWVYNVLEDGTVELVEYDGSHSDLIIPRLMDECRVTSVRDTAFLNCENLTSVTIPDCVTSLGKKNPFCLCSLLTQIKASDEQPYFACLNGVLFEKGTKTLLSYPRAKASSAYSIPEGTEAIAPKAFAYCDNLTAVTIPDGVTSIGDEAFILCESLTSVSIPDSVTSIGKMAFYWCEGLTSVSIPDSVTFIGDRAFADCPNLTLTVSRNSYAAEYCRECGLPYTYIYSFSDVLDLLNN